MTIFVADKDAYIERLLTDIGNRAIEKTRLEGEIARLTKLANREIAASAVEMDVLTGEALVEARAGGYEAGLAAAARAIDCQCQKGTLCAPGNDCPRRHVGTILETLGKGENKP